MSFSDDMKKISENISASYDARVGTLEDLSKDTQSVLKDAQSTVKNFHGDRMHMSEELRAQLSHFTKELSGETGKLLDEARKMMSEFAKAHKEMACKLTEDLSGFHRDLSRETHKMLNAFKGALNAIRNDFDKAHKEWISFSSAMSRKKSGEKAISENAPRASASPRKHKKAKRSKG